MTFEDTMFGGGDVHSATALYVPQDPTHHDLAW